MRLDEVIEEMEQTVGKMGDKVIKMHEDLIEVFHCQDRDLEMKIIQLDDRINHLEEEVNDKATSALALLSPVASDLRRVIAGIKIASELERIGDYAKNIAIFMIKHEKIHQNILDYAIRMEENSLNMLKEAVECYKHKDIEKAFEIPEQDKAIDTLYKELRNTVNSDDLDTFKYIFDVSTMFRNIEREGDHITNICEHVIYMLKGQHYDFG